MVSISPLHSLVWESDWSAPGNILDLDVLLSLRENVPHPRDFMLQQVFVGVRDLQPTDEHSGSHVIIAVIH